MILANNLQEADRLSESFALPEYLTTKALKRLLRLHTRRVVCLSLLFICCFLLQNRSTVFAQESKKEKIGIKVPNGFEVTLFADDDLAHDIFSMTIDSQGRVVVSGPGYVRILIDSDSDGIADTYKQFADGPQTGAQGMYFRNHDLICTGDAGLIRYRDRDHDDRADGPPDVFLKLKTGSEHHAHSIQKGPDGWWYLIAGNQAGITGSYATLPTSLIKKPQSGTLMRLKPDLTGGEIIADGFRNAYDFAFNAQGDVFTYDSDGERDVSLPWYRPTRVFHILPGANAGWVSRSWKRPGTFFDMPPVVASFGRGSPTGVTCYRHRQFPPEYDNALFVLDWTFGRVLALPLKQKAATWKSEPISFMTGVGQHGFAPTDIEVGPDGSLYVSVGGRGTRGRIYRVRYKGKKGLQQVEEQTGKTTPAENKLAACLSAPQPLSSWSRAKWVPLATQLGRSKITAAALNKELPERWRMRAIEILTELDFGGLDEQTAKKLASDESASVQARAVWSLGVTGGARPDVKQISQFLNSQEPLVARFGFEALLRADPKVNLSEALGGLSAQLAGTSRYARQAAARLTTKWQLERDGSLIGREDNLQTLRTAAAIDLGEMMSQPALGPDAIKSPYVIKRALFIAANSDYSTEFRLEAVRTLQLALGDFGPRDGMPAVFDGYAGRLDLSRYERALDPLRIRIASLYPTQNREVDFELARLVSMLMPYNSKLLDKILAHIDDNSHPVEDIHHLIVAARIPVDRKSRQRAAIARALVSLESKITSRKLKQDSNWDDRIGELYAAHRKLDVLLPSAVVSESEFGRPGHVIFMKNLTTDDWNTAAHAFIDRIAKQKNYPWSNDVIFVIGDSKEPAHRNLVRAQFQNFAVRNAVLMVLARQPEKLDREKFIDGLESAPLEVLTACIAAIAKLPPSHAAAEQMALLKSLRRLGTDKREYPLREKIVTRLRRNTGKKFGYVLGIEGHHPQPDVIAKWTKWVYQQYPDEAKRQLAGGGTAVKWLDEQFTAIDWEMGNATRGKQVFEKRSCAQCHGGRSALGPDLAGASRRFSRRDLFTAIADPNRDVSPRYQTTLIETDSGKVYSGLIIYESVDGLLMRNATNQTFRIESHEIEFRRKMSASLMPAGLLKNFNAEDFADLYAYLKSLGQTRTSDLSAGGK